jgi:hypothetical protein
LQPRSDGGDSFILTINNGKKQQTAQYLAVWSRDRIHDYSFLTYLKVDQRLKGVLIPDFSKGEFGAEALAIPRLEGGQSGQDRRGSHIGVGFPVKIVVDQLRDRSEPLTQLFEGRSPVPDIRGTTAGSAP